MKIQHLAVIFIIIIMPISIVFSQYVGNKIESLQLEKEYDTKLLNCTYDAIKAYQLNTINNSESDVTNSKIGDIEAAVNTFKNSLVTSFGYSGYENTVMDEYLPALVYTLYDGYYIYSPHENALTNTVVYDDSTYTNGVTVNGLKSYVYYSCRYKYNADDFVITYTLDNAITIQGTINGTYVNESGYLIDGIGYNESTGDITYDGITYVNRVKKSTDGSNVVGTESLKEVVGNKVYQYIKLNGTKYYLDTDNERIFSILNGVRTTQMSKKINEEEYKVYKKLIEMNNSAYNYYYQAYMFTNRIRCETTTKVYTEDSIDYFGLGLSDLNAKHAVNIDGSSILDFGEYEIFGKAYYGEAVNKKYIQESDSNFNQMRKAVIRYTIENNLKTAIASFTNYSNASSEFSMSKISEIDWDLIENNVTAISFLQGMNIKGKRYNRICCCSKYINKRICVREFYLYNYK